MKAMILLAGVLTAHSAAHAAPASYSFTITHLCNCEPSTLGGFTLGEAPSSVGVETFDTTNGLLKELHFQMNTPWAGGLYSLDEIVAPGWTGAGPVNPPLPGSVTFTDGKLTDIRYFVKVTGDPAEGHMGDQFMSVNGLGISMSYGADFKIENVTPVPEPATVLTLVVGLAAFGTRRFTFQSRRGNAI